jgi:hypothetical protein
MHLNTYTCPVTFTLKYRKVEIYDVFQREKGPILQTLKIIWVLTRISGKNLRILLPSKCFSPYGEAGKNYK